MTTSDWMMILAVLGAPLAAVQISQLLERRRERRQRRFAVFNTLMATRASGTSPQHVQALNSIDIEFHGTRVLGSLTYQNSADTKVLEAWKVYRAHLNTRVDTSDAAALRTWNQRTNDLLCQLLYDMARALEYSFDKAFIEGGIYTPVAFGDLESDQHLMRRFLIDLVEGRRSLPVSIHDETGESAADDDARDQATTPKLA